MMAGVRNGELSKWRVGMDCVRACMPSVRERHVTCKSREQKRWGRVVRASRSVTRRVLAYRLYNNNVLYSHMRLCSANSKVRDLATMKCHIQWEEENVVNSNRIKMGKSGGVGFPNPFNEVLLTLFYELFPSGTTEKILECWHTLWPAITKYTSENRVIRNSQLPSLVTIRDMDNFDSICEYWHTMSLD